jgi:uncharacterized protein YukE
MSEIKMDYPMMAEMKQMCQRGAEELDDTLHEVQKIAEMLESGGLIGQGGDELSAALRGVLSKKVTTLRDKFEEIGRDVQHAVDAMKESDNKANEIVGL